MVLPQEHSILRHDRRPQARSPQARKTKRLLKKKKKPSAKCLVLSTETAFNEGMRVKATMGTVAIE